RITTSNLDLRAHLASGASISMFCASLHLFFPVTANYLPVMAKSSPGYCPVPRAPCTANFTQAIVIKKNFPAKTGPETANSPCFLPVIREYQGESGRQTPLQPGLDPAEFASQQARMEPRRLEMCECGSPQGGRGRGATAPPLRSGGGEPPAGRWWGNTGSLI